MSGLVTKRSPVTSALLERAAPTRLSKARELLEGVGGPVIPDLTDMITSGIGTATGSVSSRYYGYDFTVDEALDAWGMRLNIASASLVTVTLWNVDTEALLASQEIQAVADEWVEGDLFESAVSLESGVNYTLGVYGTYTRKQASSTPTMDDRVTMGLGRWGSGAVDGFPPNGGQSFRYGYADLKIPVA